MVVNIKEAHRQAWRELKPGDRYDIVTNYSVVVTPETGEFEVPLNKGRDEPLKWKKGHRRRTKSEPAVPPMEKLIDGE